MKKRIIIIITVFLLGIVVYQAYYYVKHDANTLIVIENQDSSMNEEMMLLIDDKEVEKFTLRNHFSFIDKRSLPFGKHKITLKATESDNVRYETTISYYGIFTWNHIEYNEGRFYFDKHYTKPNLE